MHQMGMPCDLKVIIQIAKHYKLAVIEDAACAVGSEIKISREYEKIGKPHGDIYVDDKGVKDEDFFGN